MLNTWRKPVKPMINPCLLENSTRFIQPTYIYLPSFAGKKYKTKNGRIEEDDLYHDEIIFYYLAQHYMKPGMKCFK